MKIIKQKRKIISAFLLILTVYIFKPVYDFYAHMGKVPISPFGWINVPVDSPLTERMYDDRYRMAADEVIKALSRKKSAIGAASYSVAVGLKGKLVWSAALGWADIENKIPATPETIYRVGSTSKAITATALARLVEKGVVDLDQTIDHYFDQLPNETWKDITPRMLASHSAGLAHYGQRNVEKDWLGLYRVISLSKHYTSMIEALENFDSTSLRSTPGSEFYYSSQGTILLAAVMSNAASKSFVDVVKEEVLIPNDMSSTIVAPVDGNLSTNVATSYLNRVRDGLHQVRPWRPVDLSQRLAGGGFASTSTDLVKMGIATLNSEYISQDIMNKFWTPQKLSNGEINEQDYAIGWRFKEWDIEGVGIAKNANHGGVSRGAQSWLLVFPEHELVIAINANIRTNEFRDFAAVYEDILRAFIGKDEF